MTTRTSHKLWIIFLITPALVTLPQSTVGQGINDGLIAHWPFDEGGGTVAHDSSGHGNHGIISGADWVSGRCGAALKFVDTDIVESIPDTFDDCVNDGLTVSAWVLWYGEHPQTYTPYSYILDARNGWGGGFILYLLPDGIVRFFLITASGDIQAIESLTPVSTGAWTHVAAVFDDGANALRVYVGGAEDNTGPAPQPYSDTFLGPAIGNNLWAPGDGQWAPFNGVIDDLRVYARAVAPTELAQIAALCGDCNNNGLLDECDLDCGEPSGPCDLPGCGQSVDCSGNGLPDECEADCNNNGIPDDCDPMGGGDFDADGDIDLNDYTRFAACLGGPGRLVSPADPACAESCRRAFDYDGDFDVDLADYAAFQQWFSEPPELEACCLPSGDCLDLTVEECQIQTGTPQGPGTDCQSVPPCPVMRACCYADLSCLDRPVEACETEMGIPQGEGTFCGSVNCTLPPSQLLFAWSVKTHGWYGHLPIPLPLVSSGATSPGVETRMIDDPLTINFEFDSTPQLPTPATSVAVLKRSDGLVYQPTTVRFVGPNTQLEVVWDPVPNAYRYVICLNVPNLIGDSDVEIIVQVGNVYQNHPGSKWTTDSLDYQALVLQFGLVTVQRARYDITQTPVDSEANIDGWDLYTLDISHSGPVQSFPVTCP